MANESRGGGCGGVVALLSLPPLRDGFCSSRKVKFCVAEARYSGFHPLACLLAMSCFSVSSLFGARFGALGNRVSREVLCWSMEFSKLSSYKPSNLVDEYPCTSILEKKSKLIVVYIYVEVEFDI